MTDFGPRPSWLAHVLPPAVVVFLAAPVALQAEMYLLDPDGDAGRLASRILHFLPFWIGLAAGPGYLRAIYVMRQGLHLESGQRRWIHVSLVLAFLACIGGIVATWFTRIPIFPLGSAISLVVVLRVAYFLRKYQRWVVSAAKAQSGPY
jgi:hypothetical protein